MVIGERIKRARLMTCLSQRELAQKVGVSAMAISKYERGLDIPGSRVLINLARTAGVGVDYFVRPTKIGEFVPAYRKHTTLPRRQEEAILGRVRDWLERYVETETLVQGSPRRFECPDGFPCPIRRIEDVETAALGLRRSWDLGVDPIGNLIEVLEDKSIKVDLLPAGPGFDALAFTAREDGGLAVIAVREDLPGDRQRYNLAHELGHLLLRPGPAVGPEKSAHRFAGAFIVPEEVVRYELGDRRRLFSLYELHTLKHKYGLSMHAWIYRARDLRIISETDAARLFKEFKRKDWYRKEPGDQIPAERPTRMERLILHALEEEIISAPRAAELLGMPLSDFFQKVREEHSDLPVGVRN